MENTTADSTGSAGTTPPKVVAPAVQKRAATSAAKRRGARALDSDRPVMNLGTGATLAWTVAPEGERAYGAGEWTPLHDLVARLARHLAERDAALAAGHHQEAAAA